MAKVKLNPLFSEIHGKLGDFVFRTSPAGETIISRPPDLSNVKWSKAQKTHRKRFKKAVLYAQAAMADPDIRAHYEEQAASLHKRPYNLAVADYFKDRNLLEK
jgi:hypothetical protein